MLWTGKKLTLKQTSVSRFTGTLSQLTLNQPVPDSTPWWVIKIPYLYDIFLFLTKFTELQKDYRQYLCLSLSNKKITDSLYKILYTQERIEY